MGIGVEVAVHEDHLEHGVGAASGQDTPVQPGSIDRSDQAFSPTKGYVARVDLEHASGVTLSDYRYNRVFAEASAYTHFRYPSRDPMAQVLAGHIRLGYVRPLGHSIGVEVLHPRKRFYAGGANSVRGYGENQLGPRVLTVAPEDLLLRDESGTPTGCTPESIADRSCDPHVAPQDVFLPRPVGGSTLLEASTQPEY